MKTVERILPRITIPSRHASTFIEADAQKVKEVLQKIEEANLSVTSDFTSMNQLLTSLGSIPLMTGMLMPGALVMRTRCEISSLYETTQRINSQSDISYRRDFNNVGIGRVNLAGEPVFYGCVVNHDKKAKNAIPLAAAACFAETNKDRNAMRQTMAAGIWRVVKPISFGIMVQQSDLAKANSFIRQSLLPKYKFFRGDNRTSVASQLVSNYLADLYSRPVEQGEEHKYVIGACFATSLFLQGLDSIIYSSVATGGIAPNVAILPEVVDTSLELIKVRAMNMKRMGVASHAEKGAYHCDPSNKRSFKASEAFSWCPV